MFPAALRVLSIKDLKDLSVFFDQRVTIDMQDLKDLKRCFHVNDRGGQAPALRLSRPSPFTVGRGPVPRRASVGRKTALVGVRFLRRSNDRGGQAPALRAREGFFSPCAVRDQAIPNYGLILLIVIIL